MGPSTDPMAVVDPQLQVHGISGLRVMDASIMPSLVSGNTHATCVMIAEKGVQFIKDKYVPNLPTRFGGGFQSSNPSGGVVKPNYTTVKDPHSPFPSGNKRPNGPFQGSPPYGRPGGPFGPPSGQYDPYQRYQHPWQQRPGSHNGSQTNSQGQYKQNTNNQYGYHR